MRNLKLNQEQLQLPKFGILTHVEELTRYDMIYIYKSLQNGTPLRIEKDETRTWDKNALAIYFKGFKLGYVSKKTSSIVQKFVAHGNAVYATIKDMHSCNRHPFKELDIQIHVH